MTALAVRALSKTFAGTPALTGVDLEVVAGRVHALLGGNGSGKSTLIKVLAGVHQGDPGGTVRVGGAQVAADAVTPRWSHTAGLRFVHQDPALVPDLTVAENLGLVWGYPLGPAGIRRRRLARETAAALARFGVGVRPDDPVGGLGPAQRVLVAICRALAEPAGDQVGSRVLVLDEPTAALPLAEVDVLLGALRRYAAAGQPVVYVTHRLDEVPRVADDVTVLRDGVVVLRAAAADLGRDDLLRAIAGREVATVYPDRAPRAIGDDTPPVLTARGLAGGPVRGVDLDLGAGEIVGLAGLVGAGRSTTLRLLLGERRVGEVSLRGRRLPASVAATVRAGVGYVPEDRAGDAAFADLSVRDNLLVGRLPQFWRGIMRSGAERAAAQDAVQRFSVRTTGVEAPLGTLSGGNQQKVVLARWLARSPSVLLLDEPTQGVDVGARADIYRMVRQAADAGMAVLVASSDPDEVLGLCDRVLVLAGGRVVAEGRGPDVDRAWLLTHAYPAARPAVRA